jgi:hypothetical protein
MAHDSYASSFLTAAKQYTEQASDPVVAHHVFLKAVASVLSGVGAESITFELASVMFDTGALQASYISQAYIDKHRDALSHLIQPSKGSVTLGDGQSRIKIREQIRLTLTFTDRRGRQHVLKDALFYIIPLACTAILGLPHIIDSLAECFLGMIQDAAEEYKMQMIMDQSPTPAPMLRSPHTLTPDPILSREPLQPGWNKSQHPGHLCLFHYLVASQGDPICHAPLDITTEASEGQPLHAIHRVLSAVEHIPPLVEEEYDHTDEDGCIQQQALHGTPGVQSPSPRANPEPGTLHQQ